MMCKYAYVFSKYGIRMSGYNGYLVIAKISTHKHCPGRHILILHSVNELLEQKYLIFQKFITTH
jgi:hypothetical protein